MRFSLIVLALIAAMISAAGHATAAPDLLQQSGALGSLGSFKLSDKIGMINNQLDGEESIQESVNAPVQVRMPSEEVVSSIGYEFQRSSACADFLEDFADFLTNTPAGVSRKVSFTAVSNRHDGLAGYASGWLYYDDYYGTLAGEGSQYHNRYTDYPSAAPPICPFGQQTNAVMGISIDVNSGKAIITEKLLNPQDNKAAPKGPVVLEEHAWAVNLECENGVLYGFTDASPQEMFVISIKKVEG